MRLLVYGSKGLLGATIVGLAVKHGHVAYEAALEGNIKEQLEKYDPEAIINCAGSSNNSIDMIYLNALFPHILAKASGDVPIYFISTARVFKGDSVFRYKISDLTDATDVFGRTKALGEVIIPKVTNIRCAFIGRGKGLFLDIRDRADTFKGLINYRWTGSTVDAVSHEILELIYKPQQSVIHLATKQSISLYEAAVLVADYLKIERCRIAQSATPVRNFSLAPTHVLMPFQEAIEREWS